ncbi:MAG: hypothetical protein ACLFR6_03590 [Salinarchaeum sp.]
MADDTEEYDPPSISDLEAVRFVGPATATTLTAAGIDAKCSFNSKSIDPPQL